MAMCFYPWDIKWAQMCTDLLENDSAHIIHARSLGGNIKEIGSHSDLGYGQHYEYRGLPLPGAPGEWNSLEEMYYPDGPPAS